MPASHCARGCTEAGVRKASKEETAGGVCACGSVGLWGFDQPIASAVKGPGAAEGAIPRTAARKLDGGAGIQRPEKIFPTMAQQIARRHQIIQRVDKNGRRER